MGRLCKGSSDLAKLEPALSRHPSGRISNHARVFAPVIPNRIREQPLTTLHFMKPTPQISHNHGFPLTDYNYQPTSDAKNTVGRKIRKLTGFHKLSSDFL